MTKDPLFFVAIVIPEPIAGEIREFQEYVSAHFASSAALRSPPHITVVAPFSAPEERRQVLFETLEYQSHLFELIEIALDAFGAFGKRVIYVNVESDPILDKLATDTYQTLLHIGFKLRDERRSFHPHVTVAFKDLSESLFEKAWGYFQAIQWRRMFTADRIQLLEHLEGKWKPIGEFPF
jgi:2'-5' RNA ligase